MMSTSPNIPNPKAAKLVLAYLGAFALCFGLAASAGASPDSADPGVISLSSSVAPACDPPGLRFEVEVCNNGMRTLEEIELEEKLPKGMVLVAGSMVGAGPCLEDAPEAAACPCEGGVTYLKLRYVGEACAEVSVTDDKTTIFGPTQLCADSPSFELSGTRNDGRFQKNNLIFSADGVDTVIHESCSKPIGVGSVFGPFEVEGMSSRNGGTFDVVCTPPPPSCPCEGGVTMLQLQFNGDDGTAVSVVDNGATIYTNVLNGGEVFELIGSRADGRFDKNNLILNAGDQDTTIHVSCSQPIGIGTVFGPFSVLAFSSRVGGAFAAVCDGSEQAGGRGNDHHDSEEVEVCLDAAITPGACALVSYVATFDDSRCGEVEVEAKTADGAATGKTVETEAEADLCIGQALNDALIVACQDCPGSTNLASLCGLEVGVCPAPEQFQCLLNIDDQLWLEWSIYDSECYDPACSCIIGG